MFGIKPADKVKEIVEERKEKNIEKKKQAEKKRVRTIEEIEEEPQEPKISALKKI